MTRSLTRLEKYFYKIKSLEIQVLPYYGIEKTDQILTSLQKSEKLSKSEFIVRIKT